MLALMSEPFGHLLVFGSQPQRRMQYAKRETGAPKSGASARHRQSHRLVFVSWPVPWQSRGLQEGRFRLTTSSARTASTWGRAPPARRLAAPGGSAATETN
jgi:hypothetical protein